MASEKFDKTDSKQLLLLLDEAQKLIVQVRSSSGINNTVDITTVNSDELDRPDPLRIPEVIIVICVLLLWCASIFIFIRHSELLRIRHRDLPYRNFGKPPMNLNHITVVHRTSDMVIHSKPRISPPIGLCSTSFNQKIEEYPNSDVMFSSHQYSHRNGRENHPSDSNSSVVHYPSHDEQYLDPCMIPTNVRRSLLDLHRKSIGNISARRYTMSYSTNDVSRCNENDEQHLVVDERCVQESPL